MNEKKLNRRIANPDDELNPTKLAAGIPRLGSPRRARPTTRTDTGDQGDDEMDPARLAARIPR